MLTRISISVKEEVIFFIALFLALFSAFFSDINLSSINFKVIASLFALMLVILALEEYNLLEYIALNILKRLNSQRKIGIAMILTTSLLAMFVTNDVALITVVPLTITVAKKANFNPVLIIILETLAANIGSSLTPFGNPQNLYLFEYYNIEVDQFFKITALYVIIGITALLFINLFNNNKTFEVEIFEAKIKKKSRIIIYLVLFIVLISSILRIIDFWLVFFFTIIIFLILDRKLFFKVDYFLLGTFIAFFIFVDNISQIERLNSIAINSLVDKQQTLITAILSSQVISNVPTAILLSGFTNNYEELLLGVNIGGLGTIIASLANLISFKFYSKAYGRKGFLLPFHILNFGLLISISILFIYLY